MWGTKGNKKKLDLIMCFLLDIIFCSKLKLVSIFTKGKEGSCKDGAPLLPALLYSLHHLLKLLNHLTLFTNYNSLEAINLDRAFNSQPFKNLCSNFHLSHSIDALAMP